MNINITVNVTDQSLASFIKRGIIFADLVARDIAKNAKPEKAEEPKKPADEQPKEDQSSSDAVIKKPTFGDFADAYQKSVAVAKLGIEHANEIAKVIEDLYNGAFVHEEVLEPARDILGEDHPVYRYAKFVTVRDAD